MKGYVSEATVFLREFLDRHPEVVEKQRQHRATWWDRPQDLREQQELRKAVVAKKPYEYYS